MSELKRPAGISILAVIYILMATVLLLPSMKAPMDVFSLVISAILLIAAIDLFIGQQWAWWIIGTLTMLAVVVSAFTLVNGLLSHQLLVEPNAFLLKQGGRLVVQSLILIFLVTKPVRAFVRTDRFKAWQLLGILLAAALVLIAALMVLGFLSR